MGNELYQIMHHKVSEIISDVKNGRIGLPDLQRPFVWQDNKVRDLLDSMFRGFPIGYIMLWESPEDYDHTSHIGKIDKTFNTPRDLVIDGQQRLTALLAAFEGIEVKDKNFKLHNIKISFNPLSGDFKVWSQAYEKSVEYVSAISDVFAADREHEVAKFRKRYIKTLNESREKNRQPLLTDDEENTIEENIKKLLDLKDYLLPTLRIKANAGEEDVAEIFVRVNSGGQDLGEKDFIETLLAVFDNDVHEKIDMFCEASRSPNDKTAYNHIIQVEPAHLIRVTVGLGFHRGRLKYAYQLLRGKDLKTGMIADDTRDSNLKAFKQSLDVATNLNNWHAYLNLFSQAGYITGDFVTAKNGVVYCYVMYLIGKYEYKVKTTELNRIITKWIYMTTVTSFYSGSTESEVEKMFADLRDVKTADEYVKYLDDFIKGRFTDDYFNVTLPNQLITSRTSSPAWYGYIAAINVLGFPMLFSASILSKYLVPGASGAKSAIDKHHIFPKNYLRENGYSDNRDQNQVANYTYIDYATNIAISDKPPMEYVGEYRAKMGEEEYKRTCEENALPYDFENMEYQQFLEARRKLMAAIIRRGYERLCVL